MSMSGYSIGRDVTLTILMPTGQSLPLGKVTGFEPKQESTDKKIKGIDGITDTLRFHEGWSGTFEMERRGPEIDEYFAKLEENYFAGIDEPPATVIQTIVEPTGTVSQFRFERCLLKYEQPGKWAGDSSVEQRVSFSAARRIKQS